MDSAERLRRIFLLVLTAFLFSCAGLPKKCELNVLMLEDPKMPSLSEADYRDIVEKMCAASKKVFNLDVKANIVGKMSTDDFIRNNRPISDKKLDMFSDPTRIYESQLISYCEKDGRDDIKNFLGLSGGEGCKEMSGIVLDIFRRNIKDILESNIKGVKLVEKDAPENSLVYWESITSIIRNFDVIIMNSRMMDDSPNEYLPPAIHTLIRGGVATAVTSKGKARYHGTVVTSVLPFIADTAPFNEHPIPHDKINDVIAWYLSHELGHLFMYYPDIFNDERCVMNPAKYFDYFGWYLKAVDGVCGEMDEKAVRELKEYFRGTWF